MKKPKGSWTRVCIATAGLCFALGIVYGQCVAHAWEYQRGIMLGTKQALDHLMGISEEPANHGEFPDGVVIDMGN
jgi:hypothetical protein